MYYILGACTLSRGVNTMAKMKPTPSKMAARCKAGRNKVRSVKVILARVLLFAHLLILVALH